MKTGAELSDCGKYRHKLWRIWDETKPFVLWIMHNPSTADAEKDDPTIRRCVAFAKAWGYGGIYVGNLFPYRAADPKKIKEVGFLKATTVENWQHLRDMANLCKLNILAHGDPIIEPPAVRSLLSGCNYLKMTKAGNPCHPLYLKSTLKPIPLIP